MDLFLRNLVIVRIYFQTEIVVIRSPWPWVHRLSRPEWLDIGSRDPVSWTSCPMNLQLSTSSFPSFGILNIHSLTRCLNHFDILCIKIFIQILQFIKLVNLRSFNQFSHFSNFNREIRILIFIVTQNPQTKFIHSLVLVFLFLSPRNPNSISSFKFQIRRNEYIVSNVSAFLSSATIHYFLVVSRSQLCRRWSDTRKDGTRWKWCRVSLLVRPPPRRLRKMYGFHGNGTNPFNISAKMPAMHDSILVKNLGENRLSQTDTVSSCIYNLRIYIVIDTRRSGSKESEFFFSRKWHRSLKYSSRKWRNRRNKWIKYCAANINTNLERPNLMEIYQKINGIIDIYFFNCSSLQIFLIKSWKNRRNEMIKLILHSESILTCLLFRQNLSFR